MVTYMSAAVFVSETLLEEEQAVFYIRRGANSDVGDVINERRESNNLNGVP